jgi:N-methylhydantoinase A
MTVSPFADESPAPAHIGRRRAYFEDGGFQSADIFDGTLLQPGNLIPGPAIIHEADTTLVVAAGQEAMLDQHDLYVIEISV